MKIYSVRYFNAAGSAATTIQSPTVSSPYSICTSSPLVAGDAHGNNGWSLIPESGNGQSAGAGSGSGSTDSSSGSGSTSGSGLAKGRSSTSSSGTDGPASGSGSGSSGLGSSGSGGSESSGHASSGHGTSGLVLSGHIPSGQGGPAQGGTSVNGTLHPSKQSSKHISPSEGTGSLSGHSYHRSVLPSATRLNPSYPFSTGSSYLVLSSGIASNRPRVSPVGVFPTSVTNTRGVFPTGVPVPSGIFPSGGNMLSSAFPTGVIPSGVFPSGSSKPSGVYPSGSSMPSGVSPTGIIMPSGVFLTGNLPSGSVFSTNVFISRGVSLTRYSSTRTEAPLPITSVVSSCVPVPPSYPAFILQVTGGTPWDGNYVKIAQIEDLYGLEDRAVFTTNIGGPSVFFISSMRQLGTISRNQPEFASVDNEAGTSWIFAAYDGVTRVYSNCNLTRPSTLTCKTDVYTIFYVCPEGAEPAIQLGTPDYRPKSPGNPGPQGCYTVRLTVPGTDGGPLQLPPPAAGCEEQRLGHA